MFDDKDILDGQLNLFKIFDRNEGKQMRVLVACEESQEVCKAFRNKGHTAFSCDIQECSGGHPEWHICGDCLKVINGNCSFTTQDKKIHIIKGRWDLIIAHPPCTYLTSAATQCHSLKVKTLDQICDRTMERIDAMQFFMNFVNADCDKVVIENPKGVMSTVYRKPDQYIQPWFWAESVDDENYVTKTTGLWLKGVQPLTYHTNLQNPMDNAERWGTGKKKNWTESFSRSGKVRSKTFPAIAKAMAEQWG